MNYRSEIDGLRALAILPVILFHAGFKFFSGGFIGVDIFFVISGYLITSIIIKEKESGVFTLIDFYERRARRILPALFFVMLVSLPLAWFWLIPEDMKSFSKSLISICSFSSNIFYWLSEGYFSTSSELIPFLHTWSLSVEEQYYLFFPILLIIIWKFRFRFTLELIIFLALISFVLAEWASLIKPSAAFYLLPSRAWELLLGSCVALYLSFNNTYKPSKSTKNTLSFLGLFLILYGVLYLDKNTPFPGVYALIPTIGASLIILYATNETITGKVLSNKILVSVGLLSYSAYLWHQPLFAFARHRSIDNPSQTTFLILSILTFILAYFSWKYIEKPFREKNKFTKKQIFTYAACGSIFFIAIGVTGDLNKGFVSRNQIFVELANIKTVKDNRCHNSERKNAEEIEKGNICIIGKSSIPTFAIIGDSHAGALFNSVEKWTSKKLFAGYALSNGFCAPLIDFNMDKYQAIGCSSKNTNSFKKIIETKSIKYVVLVAEWANYTKGYRNEGDGAIKEIGLASDNFNKAKNQSENKIIFQRSLQKTIQNLIDANKKVIIIEPTPEFEVNVFSSVAKNYLFGNKKIQFPQIPIKDYEDRNHEVLEVFNQLKNVKLIETKNIFCKENKCNSVNSENKILFSDTNHVTEYGGNMIINELMPLILK